jgi:aldose 1-epimerase
MGLASVSRAPFGRTAQGIEVEAFTLTNPRGLELEAIGYGAIITALHAPDRGGRLDDIVLGHDDLEGYQRASPYFGAVVGRYANRMARGRFTLEGREHQLSVNEPPHHLHGGERGFDALLWSGEEILDGDHAGVAFTLTSRDGDQGYPGTLRVQVIYVLTPEDELVVDYRAACDRPSAVNLSQHSDFNLAGAGRGDVLGHELTVSASRYTPVVEGLIPTGAVEPVEGTPFDFRRPRRLGAGVDADHEQIRLARGYDHNLVLDRDGPGLVEAARLVDPITGRVLEVATTEPGLQLYTANRLDGRIVGKSGRVYPHRAGVCLETQHFPDSPNQPGFPSTILRPGAEYRSRTVFRFRVA